MAFVPPKSTYEVGVLSTERTKGKTLAEMEQEQGWEKDGYAAESECIRGNGARSARNTLKKENALPTTDQPTDN